MAHKKFMVALYHLLDENSEEKVFSYNNKVYFNTGLLDTTIKLIFIVGSSDILKVEAPVFGDYLGR